MSDFEIDRAAWWPDGGEPEEEVPDGGMESLDHR